ncbi:hypothetical protein BpHYR1_039739 [Brachionus plicatilis]|uniref:NtA domain-containing protein n=1 Tax=Brachionus plicatilis TaxID=10195 RepID=A0A3M7T5U1_BRAPC|nr:hypothetical protein BpHYR1_039739 [Brachionus plicatilis]
MSKAKFFYLVVFVLSVIYRIESLKTCIEKPIELRVENAEVICSGIVRKVDWNHSDQTYGAFVQLNNIVKGASLLNDHLNISLDNKDSMRTKPIDKADTWKNLVYIKDFGSKICESDVRTNDVRIFLVKFDAKKKHLVLNSSLIRISPVKTQNFEIISNNFNFNFTKFIKMPEKKKNSKISMINFFSIFKRENIIFYVFFNIIHVELKPKLRIEQKLRKIFSIKFGSTLNLFLNFLLTFYTKFSQETLMIYQIKHFAIDKILFAVH